MTKDKGKGVEGVKKPPLHWSGDLVRRAAEDIARRVDAGEVVVAVSTERFDEDGHYDFTFHLTNVTRTAVVDVELPE